MKSNPTTLILCSTLVSSAVALLIAASAIAADKNELDKIIHDLHDGKPAIRTHAAAELARIGPDGAAGVPALIEALDDESLAVRHEVLNALEHIGPAARAAAPKVIDLLIAKDSRLHMAAVNALGAIGRDAVDAAPLLTESLATDDERLSAAAAFALVRILPADADELKPAIPVLVKALQSKHRLIQSQAVHGLMIVGPAGLPALADLVGNHENDPHSAVGAASVLRMMGPAAARALPALIEAMKSRHDLVVTNASDAVGSIGPAAKVALPELLKLLRSEHPLVRTHAAHNIGQLEKEAAPAVGDLTNALQDKDPNVRREAVKALGEIGSPAKRAVPDLISALKDESQSVVLAAAHALARIGPDAVPALVPLIKDRRLGRWAVVILSEAGSVAAPAVGALRAALAAADDDFARDIILALGQIGPGAKDAVPDLIRIVEDKEHRLRVPAAFALGNIRASEAIPALQEAVEEDDEAGTKLPLAAAGALALIESPQEDDHIKMAIPKLVAGLNEKSDLIRREAATALRQLGPLAASAAPALLQGLNDPNPAVCIDCLWALTAIAPEGAAPTVIPKILDLMSSPLPPVRYTACYAAGSFGPAARKAIPILEKNLQDPDQFLQIASAWALVRIQPEKPGFVEECIDPLVRGLGVRDSQVRAEAAATLGLLGPAAQKAIPVLDELAHDQDEAVRNAAIAAVKAIHGAANERGKATSRSRSAR